MKINKYNNKGFTLIELLITLAIVGIVIQLIYSLFFVGSKSFNISKNKSFAQQDVRIASTFITDELRTAKEVSYEESTFINSSEKYYSLSIKDEKLFWQVYNADGTEQNLYLSNNLSNIKFIHIKGSELGIIKVYIKTEEGQIETDKQSYSLEFDILLENLPMYDEDIDENQHTIYYSKYD